LDGLALLSIEDVEVLPTRVESGGRGRIVPITKHGAWTSGVVERTFGEAYHDFLRRRRPVGACPLQDRAGEPAARRSSGFAMRTAWLWSNEVARFAVGTGRDTVAASRHRFDSH